jgi:Tfp pilus assembly protein PilO
MQIKDRQQVLTALAIAAVALLLLDKMVLPPVTAFWKDRNQQIKDLKGKIDNGEWLTKNKDKIRGRWAAIQAAALTNNISLAQQQLFRGIDQWTDSSGINVNDITPQWKDSSDSSYKTVECRVDATGSIDRVTRFLYDLEKDPMALKLQSVELTANDNTGQQLALSVQVSGLVLTPNQKTK